jgi:Tol biopolymer transport system component
MTVIREGIECPSLSPDGTRIAFKQRSDGGFGPVTWRLAVLDLGTGAVTPLAETRNVDDQAAWLDDDTVMYGLSRTEGSAVTDVWAVPADGTGAPLVLIEGAWSPRVVVP